MFMYPLMFHGLKPPYIPCPSLHSMSNWGSLHTCFPSRFMVSNPLTFQVQAYIPCPIGAVCILVSLHVSWSQIPIHSMSKLTFQVQSGQSVYLFPHTFHGLKPPYIPSPSLHSMSNWGSLHTCFPSRFMVSNPHTFHVQAYIPGPIGAACVLVSPHISWFQTPLHSKSKLTFHVQLGQPAYLFPLTFYGLKSPYIPCPSLHSRSNRGSLHTCFPTHFMVSIPLAFQSNNYSSLSKLYSGSLTECLSVYWV